MIKLTATEANKIRGIYKPNHLCMPIEIENGVFILHDEIENVKELKSKLNFKSATKFVVGDKSSIDIKYKAYLDKIEIYKKTIKL